jgi:hypothetical protein
MRLAVALPTVLLTHFLPLRAPFPTFPTAFLAPAPLLPPLQGEWVCQGSTFNLGEWTMELHHDGKLTYREPHHRWVGHWWLRGRTLHISERQVSRPLDAPYFWSAELERDGAGLRGYSKLYGPIRLRRVR